MKTQKNNIVVLFEKPHQTFTRHLELPYNERIIFSGRFGIGKSTFLNHYFENANSYNVVHLYPINYSVLQNEDIFTYLKYDILFDLIINHEVILKSSENYGITEALPFFVRYKWYSLVSLIPLISDKLGGRNLNELMKGLGGLNQEYISFTNGPKMAAEFANPFFQLIHQNEGGLYEFNKITEIINEELQNIKEKDIKKENILIIDDLDRIDPAHIFRILNVFSAHFDCRNENSKNKFGFDKVILVCDIENIRNIYAAIYGGDTDFNGYIDKFFSKEIYRFDNRDNIKGILSVIFDKIVLGNHTYKFGNYLHDGTKILTFLLTECVNQNLINLRSLLKYYEKNIDITGNTIEVIGISDPQNQTLLALSVLRSLLGDISNLKLILKNLNFTTIDDSPGFKYHISEIITILLNQKIKQIDEDIKIIDLFNLKLEGKIVKSRYNKTFEYNPEKMLSGADYKILLLELVKTLN